LLANQDVEVLCTTQRVTGVLTVFHHKTQTPGDYAGVLAGDPGIDEFELWSPRRRPEGQNFAFRLSHPIAPYSPRQVLNGIGRPTTATNAWVADPADPSPAISLEWPTPQEITRVVLDFDPDWEHPMESVFKIHAERAIPFTVRDFQMETETGKVLLKVTGNYLARYEAKLSEPTFVNRLTIRITGMNGEGYPAAVFGIGVYA
jgi:hypothetical protein